MVQRKQNRKPKILAYGRLAAEWSVHLSHGIFICVPLNAGSYGFEFCQDLITTENIPTQHVPFWYP